MTSTMHPMRAVWIMAGITLREAARRRILWTALLAAVLLLVIFAVALRLQVHEFQGRPMSPFVRYQVETGMLMVGLYTCDLLAVVMTILTSIDTISGDISSGTIHAIATKPLARWQIVCGKFVGFVGMTTVYVALTFGCTIAVAYAATGVLPEHPVRGFLLIAAECAVVLTVTFLLGTWFSTLTAGVLALGLQGVAFMGGWLEQVSGFSQSTQIVTLGEIGRTPSSCAATGIALAACGVRDADAAGWFALVFAVRQRVDPERHGARVCRGFCAVRRWRRALAHANPGFVAGRWCSVAGGRSSVSRFLPGEVMRHTPLAIAFSTIALSIAPNRSRLRRPARIRSPTRTRSAAPGAGTTSSPMRHTIASLWADRIVSWSSMRRAANCSAR